MDKRNRAGKLFIMRQSIAFCLVVAFCLMSLSKSPMEPEVSDFHWSFIGFFFALLSAFVYLINDNVGPNYGDDDETTHRD